MKCKECDRELSSEIWQGQKIFVCHPCYPPMTDDEIYGVDATSEQKNEIKMKLKRDHGLVLR